MVAATQVAVWPRHQKGAELCIAFRRKIALPRVSDGSRYFAAWRIAFFAQCAQRAHLLERCRYGNPLGEYADPVLQLQRIAWRCVSAYDVVIQHRFKIPALLASDLRQMRRTDEPLFFPGHGNKHNRCREAQLAERS